MYLFDDANDLVEAEFSLDILDAEQCIIVESSGGSNLNRGITRRNPEYNKLLSILLGRLQHAGIKISKIVLDSERVAGIPVSERVVLLDYPYPLDLRHVDLEEVRTMIGRKTAAMYRRPGATNSGNNQKRIRICLTKSVTPNQLIVSANKVFAGDSIVDYLPSAIETEREYLRLARCGQGKFRDKLMKRYQNQCPVTGISNPELLVASHIKPWSVCTNVERLDPDNGILLSVMIDRLFDRGLITFDLEGTLMISNRLSDLDRCLCRLELAAPLIMTEKNRRYMEYHRDIHFKSN